MRTLNQRHTPLSRSSRPRPVSPKRAKQLREYTKKRKAFLEAHPWCQWWMETHYAHAQEPDGRVLAFFDNGNWCKAMPPPSVEVHHKNGRTGERLNDESQWMAVSREGHEFIHANPSEARRRGWLV